MDDTILDEMDLPLANSNEELETISKTQFLPLFDVTKFEIRSEDLRDKGIDFHFEIKKANKYTNFRFAVQLKATDTKKTNKDGSISLQLYTSNINYLLNNTMPALYVLYSKSKNTFYYENLNEFVKALSEKNPDWYKQASHILRFTKALTEDAILGIYNDTIQKGLFHRKVNEKLILKSASLHSTDKILIDSDLNVSGDPEIRTLIENVGFVLINEGKWKEIILIHKNGSGNIATTSKYNLVLGVANYYSGNLIDALSFLKSAAKLKAELLPELVNHLAYFYTSTKNSLGLISDSEYQKQMDQLEDSDNVGLYIKLEKAKSNYYNSLSKDSGDKFDQLISDIKGIIDDPNADNGIKLDARCELVLIEGSKNNWDYVKGVAIINAVEIITGPDQQMRLDSARNFIASNSHWFKEVQSLKDAALESKNYFHYFNAVINEVKVIYEMQVFTKLVSIEQTIPGYPSPEMPDTKPILTDLLQKIEKALNYFRQVGHIENEVVALSAKYEIQHYLNEFSNANNTLSEAETLIETYELTDKKRRMEHLKNKGTTHQKFKAWMDEIFKDVEKKQAEFREMVADMTKMDEEERKEIIPKQKYLTIHLFPIGYFRFPEKSKQKVYDILALKNAEVKQNFDNIFEIAIPVANIYSDEIMQEGPLNGKLADRGIESWRNIYKIRKAFFENKFYRNESSG